MEIFETLLAWLQVHSVLPLVDRCGLQEGDTGLFPLGLEQVSVREDVLGNRVRRVRYSFLLRRTAVPGLDAATWAMQLQQLAAYQPPALGTDQRFWAEKGRLVKHASTGLASYEIRLIAEREEQL